MEQHHLPPPGAPPATIVDLEKGEPTFCPYCDTQLGYFALYEGTPRIEGIDGYVMLCTACARIFIINTEGKCPRHITIEEASCLLRDPFWPQMEKIQLMLMHEIHQARVKRLAEGTN